MKGPKMKTMKMQNYEDKIIPLCIYNKEELKRFDNELLLNLHFKIRTLLFDDDIKLDFYYGIYNYENEIRKVILERMKG
jgi:hypothetical protein